MKSLSRLLMFIMSIGLLLSSACREGYDFYEFSCETDADCWYDYTCVEGHCAASATSDTESVCGNSILESGEECDVGGQNLEAPNFCRPDCTLPVCGDGIIDTAYEEECDDGNQSNDDACLNTCEENPGELALEVCYQDSCYPQADECDESTGECVFPTLDFGQVTALSVATQSITIKNKGVCYRTPSMAACAPICVVTIDKNPEAYNVGLGFAQSDDGFSAPGNLSTPITLVSADTACSQSGELTFLVNFTAAAEENEVANTFIIESDVSGTTAMKIPLLARSDPRPVAVAALRAADPENPSAPYSELEHLEPLMRVYLDGTQSNDPSGEDIVQYAWEVMESPLGID